jgi:hypothetical protein
MIKEIIGHVREGDRDVEFVDSSEDRHASIWMRVLTGVQHAYDDILAGVGAGRQPLLAVQASEPFLETHKLPRPCGVRGPSPVAPKGRYNLCLLCRTTCIRHIGNSVVDKIQTKVSLYAFVHILPDSLVASSSERRAAKPFRLCL